MKRAAIRPIERVRAQRATAAINRLFHSGSDPLSEAEDFRIAAFAGGPEIKIVAMPVPNIPMPKPARMDSAAHRRPSWPGQFSADGTN